MTEDKGNVSDGYHTFNELYEHRNHLFIALLRCNPGVSWRASHHHDGTMYDGWFIAGMDLPAGGISYHLPISMWEMLDNSGIKTMNKAPEFDGHTPNDVIERVKFWFKSGNNL